MFIQLFIYYNCTNFGVTDRLIEVYGDLIQKIG